MVHRNHTHLCIPHGCTVPKWSHPHRWNFIRDDKYPFLYIVITWARFYYLTGTCCLVKPQLQIVYEVWIMVICISSFVMGSWYHQEYNFLLHFLKPSIINYSAVTVPFMLTLSDVSSDSFLVPAHIRLGHWIHRGRGLLLVMVEASI